MAALFFHSGAGTNVLQVARTIHDFSGMEFDSRGDKFRSGTESGRFLVVLILQQVFGIWEIFEQFLDECLLGLGDGAVPEGLVQLLHALTGGDVFGIAATGFSCFQVTKLCAKSRHVFYSPPDGV